MSGPPYYWYYMEKATGKSVVVSTDEPEPNPERWLGWDGSEVHSLYRMPDDFERVIDGKLQLDDDLVYNDVWTEAKRIRNIARDEGVSTPKGIYSTTLDARLDLLAMITVVQADGGTMPVTMQDGSIQPHTLAELQQLNLIVSRHVTQTHKLGQNVKSKLKTMKAKAMRQLNLAAEIKP